MKPQPTSDPEGEEILDDPSASDWLKESITTLMVTILLERDPVDALNDALLLAATLEERLRAVLDLS
jgi:hypothetical protein